jgi:hypothetical protein
MPSADCEHNYLALTCALMTTSGALSKSRTYVLLFVMQTLAILIVVLNVIPIYDALIASVGVQLRRLPQSPLLLMASVVLFHCAYWFRLLRVPLVINYRNLLLSHLVLFVGRLSFIFGTAFFAMIVFRHLPAMVTIPNPGVLGVRIVWTLLILFSLYCYAAELERLGVALRS